eukprot:15451963-Alexandrium_andersonii.AAC.1
MGYCVLSKDAIAENLAGLVVKDRDARDPGSFGAAQDGQRSCPRVPEAGRSRRACQREWRG